MRTVLYLLATLTLCAQARIPGPGGAHTGGGGGITPSAKTCVGQLSSGTVVPCTWSSAVVSGETVYCFVQDYDSSVTSFAVSDSGGNTYNANGTMQAGTAFNTNREQAFVAPQVASGATTTSVTATGTGGTFMTITCMTATGGAASPIDSAIAFNTLASTSISTTVNPTAGSADIVVCNDTGPGTITAGSGFTLVAGINLMYQVLSSSGSVVASYSYGGGNGDILCAAYK